MTRFYKFDGYNITGLIRHPLTIYRFSVRRRSVCRLFLELLYVCLINRYKRTFCFVENSKIICFASLFKHRPDIKELFHNVIDTIPKKSICYEEDNYGISILSILSKSFLSLVWFTQIPCKYSLSERLIILKTLVEVYVFKGELKKNENKIRTFKLLLVLNDSVPSGNFIVQFFQKRNIETATLQHGIVLAPRPGVKNVDFVGLELLNSNSDYFLAWNNFSKNEALKAGMSEKKIKVLGISRCIHLDKKVQNVEDLMVFGVVLDGEFTAKNNVNLIRIAKELSLKLNMRFILRYHPRMDIHTYDYLLEESGLFEGYSKKDDDIFTFMNQVRFSIIANSTAYMEMVLAGHFVLRLESDRAEDKYGSIKGGSGRNTSQFLELIKGKKSEWQLNLYNELVTVSDIRDSYSLFFRNFY